MSNVDELMPTLVREFPAFREHWDEHIRYWNGQSPGMYLDMAEFVHFVVDDLFANDRIADLRRAFEIMERWLIGDDKAVGDIVLLGFLETLQNYASWRPFGNAIFVQFLGEQSRAEWNGLNRVWAGKDNLPDVIRGERSNPDR
jgi:hypothetical protein